MKKQMLIGIGLIALGGVVTFVTYAAAKPGKTYVVTTGLFIVGAYYLIRGAYGHFTGKGEDAKEEKPEE